VKFVLRDFWGDILRFSGHAFYAAGMQMPESTLLQASDHANLPDEKKRKIISQ
jgi:hypothetical protein